MPRVEYREVFFKNVRALTCGSPCGLAQTPLPFFASLEFCFSHPTLLNGPAFATGCRARPRLRSTRLRLWVRRSPHALDFRRQDFRRRNLCNCDFCRRGPLSRCCGGGAFRFSHQAGLSNLAVRWRLFFCLRFATRRRRNLFDEARQYTPHVRGAHAFGNNLTHCAKSCVGRL